MRGIMAVLLLSLTAHAAMALELKTVPTADGSGLAQATVESVDYRVKIIFSRGARIAEFTDRKLNVNGVAWGQTVGNGFLGDRHVFTDAEYQTKRPHVTPDRITIPCKVRANDGVELTKTFVFEKGQPFIRVIYEVRNHGFKPYTLWVKNLGVPCGGERTKGDVSVTFQTQGELMTSDPWPSHFYPEVHGGWMALHRRTRKAGYFVRADPVHLDRFYFWPKSTVTPTFEWTYKPVAPGQSFRTSVLLGLLRDCDKVGWISAEGAVSATERKPPQPKAPSYAKIEGWMPLDEIYQPTEAERARGFIVTQMSSLDPRERLQSLTVDVGMDEGELVPVEIFALKKLEGLRLEPAGDAAGDPSLRAESEINYRLTPVGAGADAIAMGSYGRLWLRVLPSETPRSVTGALVVAGPDGRMELPLRFRVWPIKLPKQSMLPFNSFSSLMTMGMGQYLTGEDKTMFPAMLDALEHLGNRVAQFPMSFNNSGFLGKARVKGTGLTIYEYAKEHGPLKLEALPDLDLSYYDPAIELLKERGVTRVEFQTAISGLGARWQSMPFFAKRVMNREVTDEAEGWPILMCLGKQVRDYLRRRGLTDLWVKIADEIAPADIAPWLESARRWRSLGYKTHTTNTAGIPRNARLLRRMAEQSDGWQVAHCFLRDFINRTRKGSSTSRHRSELRTSRWSQYRNGGAVNTYCFARPHDPFPPEIKTEQIEDLVVFADGKPLDMLVGRSPWGNKKEGVSFRLGKMIYVSLPQGQDPRTARIVIEYLARRVEETGKPTVELERKDSQWYYGGGGGYFRDDYLRMRRYTWIGCYYGLAGRAHYVFYHWVAKRRLVWYEKGKRLIFSPAYEGLRDAADDSAYYMTFGHSRDCCN